MIAPFRSGAAARLTKAAGRERPPPPLPSAGKPINMLNSRRLLLASFTFRTIMAATGGAFIAYCSFDSRGVDDDRRAGLCRQ
jgi:hypothetical protein